MSHRGVQTSRRQVTGDYRRATDDYKRVKDELQTAKEELQLKYKRLHTNDFESFFEYIYKTLFSERIWFSKAPMKRWFLLNEGKSRI